MKSQKRVCVALNCGKQNSGTFHRFPKNAELRQKWIENLGLTNKFLSTKSRPLVCRRHFTKDCYGKKRVYPWAVPTLFLAEGLHKSTEPKVGGRKCCVRNCNTKSPEILHSFPKNPESRTRWLEICRLKNNRKNFYICRKHFRPSFLHRRKLLTNAFPELNLGVEDYDPLQESDSSDSSESDDIEKNDDDEVGHEVNTNCNKCSQCRELRQQIDAMRLKISQLEQRLHLNEADKDEEEYIWLLIK